MVTLTDQPSPELLRPGVKKPVQETLLTPRFYTTDFDKIANMVLSSHEEEILAALEELRPIITATISSVTKVLSNLGIILMKKLAVFSLTF